MARGVALVAETFCSRAGRVCVIAVFPHNGAISAHSLVCKFCNFHVQALAVSHKNVEPELWQLVHDDGTISRNRFVK